MPDQILGLSWQWPWYLSWFPGNLCQIKDWAYPGNGPGVFPGAWQSMPDQRLGLSWQWPWYLSWFPGNLCQIKSWAYPGNGPGIFPGAWQSMPDQILGLSRQWPWYLSWFPGNLCQIKSWAYPGNGPGVFPSALAIYARSKTGPILAMALVSSLVPWQDQRVIYSMQLNGPDLGSVL